MNTQIRELELMGTYVFHGSKVGGLTQLEPRQAYSFGAPDGKPSISSSNALDPAIFMAVLNHRAGLAMGINPTVDNPFGLIVPTSVWRDAKIQNWKGVVYVLQKSGFKPVDGSTWEFRTYNATKPLSSFRVGVDDLPDNILVIEDDLIQDYLMLHRT